MPINSFENYPMSWKPKINKNSKTLYLELSNKLEQDILNGTLLPGTKLPPQRELADFLDINVSTVSKAFKVCSLKGLLSSTIGSGTYVAFDTLSNSYLLSESKPVNIIDMGATIPDTNSFEPIEKLLKDMLLKLDLKKWFGYYHSDDNLWHKKAAVTLMKKGGYEPDIDTILFANGGQNALTAILAGVFSHGDKIGTNTHTYPGLKISASMLGIQLVPIKELNNEIDPKSLIDACKNDGIKGIYIIPDNHNPTTHRMKLESRKEIAEIAKKENIIIIEDATYSMMCDDIIPAVSYFAPKNSIYIANLSKTIAPGLRLAYISSDESYKSLISSALYNMNVSSSPLLIEIASRIIISGTIDDVLHNHKINAKKRNELVNRYLSKYCCLGHIYSIFRWIKLPKSITGTEFENLALKNGVQVYSAERFAVGNTIPERYVRISISSLETIDELESGLKILKSLLDSI